ncbi:MAG: ribonuclease Z [Paraglaciecola psychrophila]|jgi:ribonuclease Z
MRKLSFFIAITLLALAVAYSQRGSIALALLPNLTERVMTADATENFVDGLHITLCGAGGPLPDPERSGPCVAVVAGKQLLVVDAGTNGVRNLARLRYPVGEIEAVFLTHFHSDHIDGLGELATLRWVQGNNTAPLPVYGPTGLAAVVDGFNQVYAHDSIHRNDHHGDSVTPISGHGMVATTFPLPDAGAATTVYERDGVTVQMIATDHFPVTPAVAYLFSYGGRQVLISGDTNKSATVEHYAKGIDLLVHEALSPTLVKTMAAASGRVGNTSLTKIMVDILDYHASPVEAAETARDAGVGHLLYYHVVPPLVLPGSEAVWLEGVDEIFSDYTLGRDGSSFSLPANSKDIIQNRSSL